MVERTCPNCNKPAYSAAAEADWTCPYCGAELGEVKAKLDNPDESLTPIEYVAETMCALDRDVEKVAKAIDRLASEASATAAYLSGLAECMFKLRSDVKLSRIGLRFLEGGLADKASEGDQDHEANTSAEEG